MKNQVNMKTEINMFLLSIEHSLSDIMGPRYFPQMFWVTRYLPECSPTTLDHITVLAKVLGGAVLCSALLDNVSPCRSGLAPHQGVDVEYIKRVW